jgi:hypothetical protein
MNSAFVNGIDSASLAEESMKVFAEILGIEIH